MGEGLPNQSAVDTTTPTKGASMPPFFGGLLGVSIFLAVLLRVFWDVTEESTHQRVISLVSRLLHSWIFWLCFVGAGVALVIFSPVRRRIRTAEESTRVALTIFGVLPFLFFVVYAIAFFDSRYKVAALRGVFLLIVSLFPGSLYYLFIATRKFGILNEFILNLDRLGLLKIRQLKNGEQETDARRRIRIATYLLKFQAVYGPLTAEADIESILKAGNFSEAFADSGLNRKITASLTSIFSTGATVPVLLATVLMVLGWLFVLPPSSGSPLKTIELKTALNPEQGAVFFAFLGAYAFSIQMLFRRYVRRDLRGSAYAAVCLRILVAVIGTWVAVLIVPRSGPDTTNSLVLGFLIGIFPPIVWQLLRQFVKTLIRTDPLPQIETQFPISELDGLNLWHQSRLEEEDIENVHSMATADLVDLMLNTRFPPDRIIDWVDQAILYSHLGPKKAQQESPLRKKLEQVGIRTASALVYAHGKQAEHGELDGQQMQVLVDSLSTNPNLRLVQEWRSLPISFAA